MTGSPRGGAPLRVEGLAVRRGGFRVGELTLAVRPSSSAALVGPNGSGKSTLLLAILGLLPPCEGHVEVNGSPVTRHRPPVGLGALLSWPGFYPWVSGVDNLRLAADGEPTALARVDPLLDEVGLRSAAHRPVEEYSTGMIKRLEMARALLSSPTLLVLDEPTNGLDGAAWTWLAECLQARVDRGDGVLIATHDTDLVRALGARRVVVDAGRVETRTAPT